MANITTQTIRVDLSTDKVIPSAFTHQNDSARTLVFDMYNGGVPYTMTGNTVKFAYKSPIVNGQYSVIAGSSMASGTVSGNKVSVTLPVAYTQISGVGMLTMIITTSGNTLRPVNIRLVVQKSATSASGSAQTAVTKANEANTSAESASQSASSASQAKADAEQAKTDAISAKNSAEESASLARQYADSVDMATVAETIEYLGIGG